MLFNWMLFISTRLGVFFLLNSFLWFHTDTTSQLALFHFAEIPCFGSILCAQCAYVVAMVYINKHKYEESTDIDETLIETIIFVFIKMQTHLQPFSLDNSL